MTRSKIAQLPAISQERLARAKSQMLNRLYGQILYRMCGILGTKRRDSILQAAIEGKVYVAVDDGLEDGSHFHIFGNKEFQYAISMRVLPMLCSVEISVSS